MPESDSADKETGVDKVCEEGEKAAMAGREPVEGAVEGQPGRSGCRYPGAVRGDITAVGLRECMC